MGLINIIYPLDIKFISLVIIWVMSYVVQRHFEKYFRYISFIGGGHRVVGKNHRPVESH